MEQHDCIVISDCRFNNEAEAVLAAGGIVIEVTRADINEVAAHSSENGISSKLVTFRIDNNGTLQDLYKSVDSLLIQALAA